MNLNPPPLKYILAAAVLALLSGCDQPVALPPGGFAAQAKLSTESLQIGDPVTLTLTARHPAGSVVRFPTIGKGKEIVVRGRSSDTNERAEGIQETSETYHLTSLRVGNWLLTTNTVACTFADGTEKVQALPKLFLNVESTLDETNATKLSGIKGALHPPLHLPRWAWVFALIVLLAAIAGLIVRFCSRKSTAIPGSEPIEPPQDVARKALEALRDETWMPEPFFVKLSLILRTYLEGRFELDAPESTTEELAGKLKKDLRLSGAEQMSLRKFFTQADLVKFARADAEQAVMRTAFSTVETFVEQTQEPIQEPQKNTQGAAS